VVFGLGVLITAFFSNDATALILTPIVFVLVTRFKLKPLPYVFACAFIANTASMLLPVSNPVNLLPVDSFGITLGEYLKFTLLPSLLAITINIGLFMFIFRKDIAASFKDQHPEPPVRIDAFFRFVCVVLGLTAVGYVLTSVYGKPVSWPAMGGAATLLAGGFALRRLKLRGVASGNSSDFQSGKGAVAVVAHDVDCPGWSVRENNVDRAVCVNITSGKIRGAGFDEVGDGSWEGTLAITAEYAQVRTPLWGH
jgi:arsenical pump membrane protein